MPKKSYQRTSVQGEKMDYVRSEEKNANGSVAWSILVSEHLPNHILDIFASDVDAHVEAAFNNTFYCEGVLGSIIAENALEGKIIPSTFLLSYEDSKTEEADTYQLYINELYDLEEGSLKLRHISRNNQPVTPPPETEPPLPPVPEI